MSNKKDENAEKQTQWIETDQKIKVMLSKDKTRILFFINCEQTGHSTISFGYHKNFFAKILEKKAS